MRIVLGSKSRGRREVLESLGYELEILSADIDEKAIRHEDPEALTLLLAHAKADALLPRIHHEAILITSDQVVVCNGTILEKPENEAQAREYLHRYATFPAQTVTAVVVTNTATGRRAEGIDVARVVFREIPNDVIDGFLRSADVFRHAGGFSIEDPLLKDYIARIEGEPESVKGLPKALTKRLLQEVQE
jgi:septum formation protein